MQEFFYIVYLTHFFFALQVVKSKFFLTTYMTYVTDKRRFLKITLFCIV